MESDEKYKNYCEYTFAVDGPDRQARDVISLQYTPAELAKKFVVHGVKNYRVYENPADFYADLEDRNTPRCFHETSFGGPQRLKVDVDCDTPGVTEETYVRCLREIIGAIIDAMYVLWQVIVEPTKDICICVTETLDLSGRPTAGKFSNHLIVKKYFVSDNRQAAAFARQLHQYISPEAGQYLDLQPYSKTQDFRLPGCHKKDQPCRVKRVVNGVWSDALFTQTAGLIPLRDIVTAVAQPVRYRTTEHVDAILELLSATNLLGAHSYKNSYMSDGIIYCIFVRAGPSVCNLCTYEHPKDNTLLVRAVPTAEGLAVYEDCRRQVLHRKLDKPMKDGKMCVAPILLGVLDVPCGENIGRVKSFHGTEGAICRAIRSPKEVQVDWGDLSQVTYDEPTLRDFPLCDTLFVKAAMKMGKTKKLNEYLAKYFVDTPDKQFVIRFVSFRQTFSGNLKEKFPEFTLYNEETGFLYQPRLIIQVESLHRLSVICGGEPPDLLILDECESIFEQFDSGLVRLFNASFDKFKYLVRHSKHVICMDAHLGRRTLNVMRKLRGSTVEDSSEQTQPPERVNIVHHCLHKNATNDTYWICADKAKWLAVLYEALDRKEKIAIPSSSLTDAKMVAQCIKRRYPQAKICLYSRETLTSTKVEHFARVDHYWSQYDVLIYTPTITAGVSFELVHFDKVFGFFTNVSCPVETCIQMIGRIRDVSAHSYFICLSVSPSSLPTTEQAIVDRLYDSRRCLVAEDAEDAGVSCDYTARGNVVLHFTDYYYVWLENKLVRNTSAVHFVRHFVSLVSSTGATVLQLSTEELGKLTVVTKAELGAIAGETKSAREQVKSAEVEALHSAPDLTAEQVENISARFIAQDDVSPAETASFERYKLRKVYGVTGELTQDFIAKYNKPGLRAAFKNCARLKGDGGLTLTESIGKIKEDEMAYYRLAMGSPSTHFLDLKKRYVWEKHNVVCGLLDKLGFCGPFDIGLVADTLVNETLVTVDFAADARKCAEILEVNVLVPTGRPTVTTMIKCVNALFDFYAVKLRHVRKKSCYELTSGLPV